MYLIFLCGPLQVKAYGIVHYFYFKYIFFLTEIVLPWGFSSYLPSRRSVWENVDRSHEYSVWSVHMTEVKILPNRPTKLG